MISQLIVSQQQQTKEFVKLMATNGRESDKMGVLIRRQVLMQLPRFDGSPKQWPNFKKTFEDTTREGEFSYLENLNRLKQVLHGTAYRSVQQLMMEAENVPEIIKRLDELFGRPDLVYLKLLSDLQKLRKDSRNIISDMTSALENIIKNVILMGQPTYLNDHRRAEHMVAASSPLAVQNLEELCRWLKPYAKTAEMMNTISIHTQKGNIHLHEQGTSGRQATNYREKQITQTNKGCLICNKPHATVKCYALVKQTPPERVKTAIRKQLCFGCLNSNKHSIKDCKVAKPCGIAGCSDKHNKMLHVKQVVPIQPEQINSHHDVEVTWTTHYQTLPVKLINGDKSIQTYAFLDPGSSLTMIEAKKGQTYRFNSLGHKGQETSQQVQLVIKGATKKGYRLKDVRTIKELKLPLQSLHYDEISGRYPYLRGLPIESCNNVRPTILIGLNNNHLLMGLKHRPGKPGEPIGMKTRLG
uniref:Peptidase A2 domain-containing protein n=1 Tax=Anopheles funestus TaxID=62324 RepID=A0A182R3C6_ANOFN